LTCVAIVTGAGTGIGRATATLLARSGARTVLVGRRLQPLEESAAAMGHDHLIYPGDLRDAEFPARIVVASLDRFGRIDVLVNNAGVAGEGLLVHETGDELWEEIIDVNLTVPFRMARAVLPHFLERRSGVVINVASVAGSRTVSHAAAYCASKAGLMALTRSIAADYGAFGIRCNCVCPGTIATDMTANVLGDPLRSSAALSTVPAGRPGTPAEVASAIAFLADADSAYLNGAQLNVDGGMAAC
jgi:meso-butanediol dehydrogenase/(S,S)-butanediol dehydrogenase/diacetyl reductase